MIAAWPTASWSGRFALVVTLLCAIAAGDRAPNLAWAAAAESDWKIVLGDQSARALFVAPAGVGLNADGRLICQLVPT
jgi:hypothetical protein